MSHGACPFQPIFAGSQVFRAQSAQDDDLEDVCFGVTSTAYSKRSSHHMLQSRFASLLQLPNARHSLLQLLLLNRQVQAQSLALGVLSQQLSADSRIASFKLVHQHLRDIPAQRAQNVILETLGSGVDEAHNSVFVVAHDGRETVDFGGPVVHSERLGEPGGIACFFLAFLERGDFHFGGGLGAVGFECIEVFVHALQVALLLKIAEAFVAKRNPVYVRDDGFLLFAREEVAQAVAFFAHQFSDEIHKFLLGASEEFGWEQVLEDVVDSLVDERRDDSIGIFQQTVNRGVPAA